MKLFHPPDHPSLLDITYISPDVPALEKNLECLRSLLRQMQLAKSDHGKFDRLYSVAQEEVGRAMGNASRNQVKLSAKPLVEVPVLAAIEQTEEAITHDFDPLSLLVRHKGWVRFMDDEKLGVRPQFTHKIMPGTYHLLATDGIRGIVSPADAPERREVIVHMTNLKLVPKPPEPKEIKLKTPRAPKAAKYSIEDLI